jgi:PilZ domain-containing protein
VEKETPAGQSAQRRTERVLIQIPIEVKGNDTDGRAFRETTRTVVINRDGARIALRSVPRPNAQVTITNLQSQKTCQFRVVSRVQKTIGLEPEWGVECLDPKTNFWGILFPDKEAGPPPAEMVDVLLECTVCRTRELAQLPLASYRKLVEKSLIGLKCSRCKDSTDWRLCFIEEEAGAMGAPAKEEKTRLRPAGIERRRAKRLTAKMPLRLRKAEKVEEITRTENLSKTGVCFYSKLQIVTGEEIRLTVGYAAGSPENEIRARVVWGRAVGGNEQFLYGAELEAGK